MNEGISGGPRRTRLWKARPGEAGVVVLPPVNDLLVVADEEVSGDCIGMPSVGSAGELAGAEKCLTIVSDGSVELAAGQVEQLDFDSADLFWEVSYAVEGASAFVLDSPRRDRQRGRSRGIRRPITWADLIAKSGSDG